MMRKINTRRLVVLAASLATLASTAHAQMTVSPRGPYGAMITTPGGQQMPAYAVPNGGGGMTYVVPGQPSYGTNPNVQCEAWRYHFGHCVQ